MIKPEQVPIGVTAVFDAVYEMTRSTEKAIAAALNAWPGAGVNHSRLGERLFILPLTTQENENG